MADGDDMILTGQDALKSVCSANGAWNWALIGADPEQLPLAGGGSGFIDEMRACLEEYGGSVLTGILRMEFQVGASLKPKWVVLFLTLDGQEAKMSAVQRGKALGKRPAMEKVFGQYCKVITDTWEVTYADQLTQENILARVQKASVLDGPLEVPKWDPSLSYQPPTTSQVIEEFEPEQDAAGGAGHEEPPMGATATENVSAPTPAPAAEEAPKEETIAEEPKEEEPAKAVDPLTASVERKKAEKKEPEKAPEPEKKAAEFSVEKALGGYNKGDLVDIWSHTENKWFTDGMIEEVRDKASATADGKPLPAGCAKIVYSNGQRGKWLQPEVLNDKSVVKPSIKPPGFQGFMKKETHNMMSEWHTRYFECKDGFLTWWVTIEDSKAGVKPQCSLELVGLQMKNADKSTKISIRTASSRGVVYNFDTNAGTTVKSMEDWVTNLKLHASYANRMYKFRTAGSAAKK